MVDVNGEIRPEFMTTWHTSTRPEIVTWSRRNRAHLIGSAKSSRYVPAFRAFDLLAEPNQALVLLENEDHRIGVESVCGEQDAFLRHVDFDTIYFQYCGTTTIETEYGNVTMVPGELLLIHEGISHRSTGSADSLRWFAHTHEPIEQFLNVDDTVSYKSFEVTRVNGPEWSLPPKAERTEEDKTVTEKMICWRDGPDDYTVVEHYRDDMGDLSSTKMNEQISGIRKVRIFDLFKEIAGKRNDGQQPIFRSKHLEIKTYNVRGEQYAFHRPLRTEEVRIQFRGNATDMSEFETTDMFPGQVSVIPLGIAHSVETDPIDDPNFLRMNFYSDIPWTYPNDLTKHAFDSRFEVVTTVHAAEDWLKENHE
jgi:mannose-6-phosphate isomerase-like protein (cupin superfamily)